MEAQNRPGVIRLLLYMILAAAISGGAAGWIQASGAFDWLSELDTPTWAPNQTLLACIWIGLMQLQAIGLWIVQRSGRDGFRSISTILIFGLLAAPIIRLYVYYSTHDVTLGFIVTAACWLYGLVTLGIVQRASKPAALLLWPSFILLTYMLALNFEFMRLNTGATVIGGL
jgi:tryptophan-rich sensory protein